MFQSQTPNWFLGNLLADVENGDAKVVCACDKEGKVVWLHSDKVEVVSIDGKLPSEYCLNRDFILFVSLNFYIFLWYVNLGLDL